MPGVHAYASEGVAAIAMIAMHTTPMTAMNGCPRDSREIKLNPDALPLPAHCLAEVIHLGADNVVDRFLRTVDVFAH